MGVPGRGQAAESAGVTTAHDTATLITDSDSIAPGARLGVALRLALRPGWHTYWLNPGDAGEAPTLDVSLGGGAKGTGGTIEWPTPRRILESGLMAYAYVDDVVLPLHVDATAADGAPDGDVTIKAHAAWLVCADVCVPEKADFALTLRHGAPGPSAQAPLFARAEAARPVASPFEAVITPDAHLILSGHGLGADVVRDAWFMPDQPGQIDQAAPQPLRLSGDHLSLGLRRLDGVKPDMPQAGVLVIRDRAGEERALTVTARPGAAPAGMDADATRHQGLWRAVLLAFVGGAILNLMPCVFPVLAMKALALARLGGAGQAAQRRSALLYATGVIVSFAILGGGLMALRVAGDAVGWGFQFQSPAFVTGIAWLLFVMALNLSGMFEITIGAGGGGVRSGALGDLMTGVLAVIVASPCTAPFMGVAIAAALGSSAVSGLLIFVAMGVGLAAPSLALAVAPALASRMPRPGAWMDILRQALAFPLLGTCVWLLWVASLQAGPGVVVVALGGAVGLALAAWLFGLGQRAAMRDGARGRVRTLRAAALGLVLGVISLLPGLEHRAAAEQSPGSGMATTATTTPFTEARLASLRASGQPVFIDMTAAWCITCLVNERVALSAPSVRAAFDAAHVAVLRGDWTNRDAALGAFLQAHGRDGVPLYVFYPPHGEAQILPQILTPGIVLDALKG
ncbi:thioredoxin family protein [Ameyamaea chiangmaiensis]|nr:thioredoxin family protein [Ameyamaea chiangmaiensis]MBS4076430.1 thioredoxin family protein [Ameyamaea chiangmaiensis]